MARGKRPGGRYWAMIKPVWLPLGESWEVSCEEFLRRFRAVQPEVGHLYAAHWCQSEVCNGGLHQFFYNTTGLLSPEALNGFRAIGLAGWADILSEAMQFFGDNYPRERTVRLELLPEWPPGRRKEFDPFDKLDERFYEWLREVPDGWNLAADTYAERSQC